MPKTHRTIPPLSQQDINRFWSKVDKTPGQGTMGTCWLWTAGVRSKKTGQDYGAFAINRVNYPAPRVAYFICHGEDLGDFQACHACDTPLCCNPTDIFKGTQKDNREDAVAKNRVCKGDDVWSRKFPDRVMRGDNHTSRLHPERLKRGEASGCSKLNDAKVRAMRRLFDSGKVTDFHALGRMFDVSNVQATNVCRRVHWRHLP